jgi:primosomal protein N' (replication factor Y)
VGVSEQRLPLATARSRRTGRGAPHEPAGHLPVARVSVDAGLAHLDRPFDYLVPATLADAACPGARVRVRFAGRLVNGILLDRVTESAHSGSLAAIERVVSPEPVLSPEIARLARRVADRSAGTLADVLRLALPPRHARVEAEPSPPALPAPTAPDPSGWSAYDTGGAFLAALGDGRAPRAAWAALPGASWPDRIAEAVRATLASGRGSVVVLPDGRDVARVADALDRQLGAGRHLILSADLGPAERYRRWLAVRRGSVRAVVGTRAAAFAPVRDLGLAVLWDDGDDVLAERRAPYCHPRDVLLLRAELVGAGALLGGFARTAEVQLLLDTGWAHPLTAPRPAVRAAAPRVSPTGDDAEVARDPGARTARLPTLAWRAARAALDAGAPVLVQVPRRGYLPALSCARCRAAARCTNCAGPIGQPAPDRGLVPTCRWCGRLAGDWACAACGGRRLRAAVVGARRTAEELGRAFPGVPVRTSGRDEVLARVPDRPALVVATPGAEPVADGGYGAALLLDAWALLGRPDLRAGEETLRRWLAASALVRPAADGGHVVVTADGGLPAVQALLRWDPAWHAGRELADRAALGFPPATRIASVTGAPAGVTDLLAATTLPEGADLLGPVPVADERERLLIRAPRSAAAALAAALAGAQALRSARKAADPVRVELDPLDLF